MLLLVTFASKALKFKNLAVTSSRRLGGKMCEASEKFAGKKLAPPLAEDRHKGQAGRIGVFGGSLEYTGAPYFAAIAALKVGADLSYVFCKKEAAVVIKSYSPELIVLPFLDDPDAIGVIEPWLDRLHVVLIGPGLGRQEDTFQVVEEVIRSCRAKKLPLIIDADGLFLVARKPAILREYPAPVVLTPNVAEFGRLVGENGDGTRAERSRAFFDNMGGEVTMLCKGRADEIVSKGGCVRVAGGGSGRRCGGQGDILGGALATFLSWALSGGGDVNLACYSACRLTRDCNAKAFAKHGRSMTATDMIAEIHEAFEEKFELK